MRVLIACEFSGIVRDAFIIKGHDAWSCDYIETEILGPHLRGNVLQHINKNWDLMISFPPCTHLAVSGARWFNTKLAQQILAVEFIRRLMTSRIPKTALENPIGIISTCIRKPDQIIQPWQFGHNETKATCLWLKNLPLLRPTKIVPGRIARVHRIGPSPTRWKQRSRTLTGIALAMAEQWG